MIDETRSQRRAALLFFLGAGVFLAAGVGYLAMGATDPEWYWRKNPTAAGSGAGGSAGAAERIILTRDRPLAIGGVTLTYRGLEARNILLEVMIPSLDPGYAYPHRIPLARARQGVTLAGRRLKLLSARGKRARILVRN